MKTTTKPLTLLLLILIVFWSFSELKPSYNSVENQTDPTKFSINSALYHLKNISQKPHAVGTDEHKHVQQYLFNELKKIGLTPSIQKATVFNKSWKAGTSVENIVAKIEGTANTEKSLLVLSHYDSNPHSAIGAADAGSGVVTILEGIRAFLASNKPSKNDIIVVFSDAEELGLLGAQAFAQQHEFAKGIGVILNFEARGSGGPSYMLMETNGKNSKLLSEFLNAKPNFPLANSLMYSIYKMLPNDTDLTVFREECDINGFNVAFIGDHFDYHTVQDNYARLDRSSLAHQADYFTTLVPYFANSDISNLHSDTDWVYANFPLIKIINYPFAWVLPLLIIASLLFITLLIMGIRNQKINIKDSFKGIIPFLLSILLCTSISYGLWQIILIAHPYYQDILHGFPYNGYTYVAAFCSLNVYIVFKTYNFFIAIKRENLLIAPIFFWLIINCLIYLYLKGAGFFIIPVFIALLSLTILIFSNIKTHKKPLLFTLIAIPTIYMLTPIIKMFPVGLGLKNIFISGLFIALTASLLTPIFHQYKKKNGWQFIFGVASIILFLIATFNSEFSYDKKKPNSLLYVQDDDNNNAYWATYNKTLDAYTKQIFDTDYEQGGIKNAETKSKYNSTFSYHKKTKNRNIKNSELTILKDTIVDNLRLIDLSITPSRKINKFEIYNNQKLILSKLIANTAEIINYKTMVDKGTLLIYHMASSDTSLKISMAFDKNEHPNLTINEVSNDLLTHPSFKLTPRTETMMPMPFVTNDAIICTKTIKL